MDEKGSIYLCTFIRVQRRQGIVLSCDSRPHIHPQDHEHYLVRGRTVPPVSQKKKGCHAIYWLYILLSIQVEILLSVSLCRV